jgi:hypothetical protein
MAISSFPATDRNDNSVTVYNSDDPAEGGGSTLDDIVTEAGGINTVIGSQSDMAQTDETVNATQMAYIKGQLAVLKAVRDAVQGTVTTTDDGSFDINSLPDVTVAAINDSLLVQGEDESNTAQPLPLVTVDGNLGLRVFDQLAIQAQDNQIQNVPDTDRVVAGSSLVNVSTAHTTYAQNSETSIVSSSGGNIRVLSYKIQSKGSSQVVAELRDGSAGSVLNQVACGSFGDGAVEEASQGYLFETSGNDLYLHLNASVEVSIRVTYIEA